MSRTSIKIFGGLVLFILSPFTASAISAPSGQVFSGTTQNSNITNTRVNYLPSIEGLPTITTIADNSTTASSTFSVAGMLSSFYVKIAAAPGAGTSYTFALRKNLATTTLTCTISNTNTTCNDTSDVISVAVGDSFTIAIAPTGSPTGTGMKWSLLFVPSQLYHTQLLSQSNNYLSSTGGFQTIGSDGAGPSSVEATSTLVLPISGTLSSMFTRLTATPGSIGRSRIQTINNNTVATTLTCSVASGAGVSCTDNTDSVSVTANDLLDVAETVISAAAQSKVSVGLDFLPVVKGDFAFLSSLENGLDGVNITKFTSLSGSSSGNAQTTDSVGSSLVQAMVVKKIVVSLTAPPGMGNTKIYTLQQNGANTALTCTVVDLNTSCTGNGLVTFANGDTASTKMVTSASAARSEVKISYVASLVPLLSKFTVQGGAMKIQGGSFKLH